MRAVLLAVIAVAVALPAAAAPKAAARKPAAPVKAAPAPRPAAPAGGFDATNPASLIALLQGAGAQAQVARKEADSVLVAVTSRFANFTAQFAQCGPEGRGCKAVVLDTQAAGAPSLAQLNGFNQASALCRGYVDKANKAHVTLGMMLFADETQDHVATNLAAWQGCIADFTAFTKDPVAYLANSP
jgi:hypothetical protein